MGLESQNHIPFSASERTGSEHSVETTRRGLLERLRSGVRAKVLAAGLAIGGAALATEKAGAGLVIPAEVLPASSGVEPTDFNVGFVVEDGAFIQIGNADDNSDEPIDAVMVHQPEGYAIDWSFDNGSDVPTDLTPDSGIDDGIMHDTIMYNPQVSLQEGQVMRFFHDTDPTDGDPNGPAVLGDFYSEAEVLVAKNGTFSGTPTTPQEFIDMYSGDIYRAIMPANIPLNEVLIMRETQGVPEPSSAILVGAGAAGIAAAGRRRRKRNAQ